MRGVPWYKNSSRYREWVSRKCVLTLIMDIYFKWHLCFYDITVSNLRKRIFECLL